MADARNTQQVIEISSSNPQPPARISQATVEATLKPTAPNLIYTQVSLEAYNRPNPMLSSSQMALEIWTSPQARITNATMLTQQALVVWTRVTHAQPSRPAALLPSL